MIRRVAPTRLPALVLGPSGTGKALVARAIHAASLRSARPLVPIHWGAVPAELLESELFGHLKANFIGAATDRPGLIETTDGGTLFLDEIGEMPAAMQVKLLRFLADGSYQPVRARTAHGRRPHRRRHPPRPRRSSDRRQLPRGSVLQAEGRRPASPSLDERASDVPLLDRLSCAGRATGAQASRPSHSTGWWRGAGAGMSANAAPPSSAPQRSPSLAQPAWRSVPSLIRWTRKSLRSNAVAFTSTAASNAAGTLPPVFR